MDVQEFINKLKLAANSKTRYKTSGWGSHDGDLWYFDCVCLLKAILWGWNADLTKKHGGAVYKSNGVPDIGDKKFFDVCTKKSSDFKTLQPGEIVWMDGHVGACIAPGKVVEATAAWDKKVVISDVAADGTRSYKGKKVYKWKKHGFSPYINYRAVPQTYPGEFPTLPARGYFYYPGHGKAIDKGTEVVKLQAFLNWAINAKLKEDGLYGPGSVKKVKKFEKEVGTIANGMFGKKDLAAAKKFTK